MDECMNNKEYIAYLNSLHSYNAKNSNAYGEKNVKNDFFEKVLVEVGLCSYIKKQLEEKAPQVIILTGHAGDGKTSIMYKVLKDFGIEFDNENEIQDIKLPNGKECRCIKDFSELNDEKKKKYLKESLDFPNKGNYAFIVSNTGRLINIFTSLFDENDQAEMKMIDAIDDNSGEIKDIKGYKLNVINVASIDNTNFAVKFVENMIKDELWEKCKDCSKCSHCYIFRNRNLIVYNQERVLEFIRKHYIWLAEHGTRLTIRSMTEQLAYMITGGVECEDVREKNENLMLFFNLFFGYLGLRNNKKADTILAIKESKKCGYDRKRLRVDEKLMINCDYKGLFNDEMNAILIKSENSDRLLKGWIEFIRRAYIFTNIVTDKQRKREDNEDIFSKQFERYLTLRDNENEKLLYADNKLIIDALSMMYLGKVAGNRDSSIPITLNKASGLTQNVQLVTGAIYTRDIKLEKEQSKDGKFDENSKRYKLYLNVNKNRLDYVISLPMLDYFEELKNGVISTNIDPQLSHGVESLKAQLARVCKDDDDIIEIVVLKNKNDSYYKFEITNDNDVRIV